MGTLDYLISSNKTPIEGMSYIYIFDKVWLPNELGSYPIKYGSDIIDVVKLENDSFEFTVKETGKRCRTNYGWAIAENTPENLEKIKRYLESDAKLDELKKETYKLRDEIIDLDGPKKI